ncbi:trypsin-like serine peptidase [Azospirillum rugosum]|uniref:Protease YdgD n=1 Tax=Azospirillum rugosum TaxID=416170 RepID=A0ABS4SHR3_9PROT|nr:trypsin-like serine protease [Azospirillum rugosum]MBP2292010.1 protease YdgD [Azospirillum rugosum]MDQ0525854.1 protease YdgD [Azospirillum rugosum]
MKTYQERVSGLLAALLVALSTSSALAQSPALPGIGAQDRRAAVDTAEAPWRSLVKVQTNLGSRCTGVLVAPRRVATAAHCLLNRAQQILPASSLHVLFGYDRGDYREHRTVASLTVGGPFDPGRRPEGIARDWAVLTLSGDAPAGVEPLPLVRVPPEPGTPLMLGGYSQDKAQIVTADTACAALGVAGTSRGTLLIHDCNGTRGVSGAALLVRTADGQGAWGVAGIAVAAQTSASPRNIAVPAASFVDAAEGAALVGKAPADTPSLR